MTVSAAKILEQARQLSAQDKLMLVDRLIAELDVPDPAIEALWAEEAQRRSSAVKQGTMTTRPLDEALAKHL